MKTPGKNIQYSDRTIQFYILQSNLKSLDVLESVLKKMKRKLDLSRQIYCSIWVSVNEAISNAIIHGNKFNIDKKVRLMIQFKQKHWICFTIKDEGCGFDHKNIHHPKKVEHETKAYGSGVSFMKKMADAILYSKKGTSVDLYFNLSDKQDHFT